MGEYLSEIQERFKKDLFATKTTGVEIVAVGEYYAKCILSLTSKHRNAMGEVMGGVIYTLADFAFAVAANHKVLNTVSTSGDIKFLKSTKGNILYAEARCLKNGRTTCFYDITINDDCGSMISKVSIVGTKINVQK